MDNKKFEQLIDLIINENEEQARELFHDIVVEKSREIYESIMDEEMMEAKKDEEEKVEEAKHEDSEDAIEESMDDMEEGEMVGEVGDLLDEINVEEAGGMTEGDEEDLEVVDMTASEAGDDSSISALADKMDDLDAKLDALMAEFTGGDADDSEEEVEVDVDSEDEMEVDGEEEENAMMEAVTLKKVPGLYNNKIGGDNGANSKSPTLTAPKVKTAGVNPVKFSGDSEAVPNGPKAPSNYGAKGEKDVPGAGKFKNVPGQDNFKEKGEAATKPHLSQATGVNTKSPVAKS